MLQHRFCKRSKGTSSSLKRYHFSTRSSRLLCKVGTIFDIPTSQPTIFQHRQKTEKLLSLFSHCLKKGGKVSICHFPAFFRYRKTYVRIIQCDTILQQYFSNIPFQAVNFIIPSFFTLGNEKFMRSLLQFLPPPPTVLSDYTKVPPSTSKIFSLIFKRVEKHTAWPKKKKCLTGPILKIMRKKFSPFLLYKKVSFDLRKQSLLFSPTHFSKWMLEMT